MSSKERITDEFDEKQTAYMSALERVNKVKEKESEIEVLESLVSDPNFNALSKLELEKDIEEYHEKLDKANEELEKAKREVEKARNLAKAKANTSLRRSLIDYSVGTWKITEIKGANKVWESPALPGVKITEKGRSGQPSWTELDEGALQNKIFQELKKMKGEILGKSKINTSGIGYKPGGTFRADRENRGFGKNPYWLRTRGTTTLYGSTNPAQKEKDLKRLGEGNNRWDWLLDGGTNTDDDKTGLSITVTKEDVRRLEKEYKEFYQKMGLETTWTTGLGFVTTLPWVKKGTQQPIIINDYIDILAPQYLKRASVASDAPTTIDSKKSVVTPSAYTPSSKEVIEATETYNEALKKVRRKETHIKDLEVRLATLTLKANLRAEMEIAIKKHGLELLDLQHDLSEARIELARAEAETQAAAPAPGPAPKPTWSWFGPKATVAPAPSSKNWRKTTNTLTEEQGENEKNEIQSLIRHLMFFRDSLTGNLDKTKMDRNIVLPNTGISALKESNFSINITQKKNGTRRKSKGNWTPLVYSFRTDDPHKTGLEPSKLPTGIDEDASNAGVYICVSYPGYYNLTTILSGRNTMTEILEAMLGYARENYRSYYDDVLIAYLIATKQKKREEIEIGNSIHSQVLNIYKKRQGITDDIDERAQKAKEIQGLLENSSIEAAAQFMANTKLKPFLKKEQNEQLSAKAKEKEERVLQIAKQKIDQRRGTAAGNAQAATASAVVSSVGGMNQGGGGGAGTALTAALLASNLLGSTTHTNSGRIVPKRDLTKTAVAAAVTPVAAATAADPLAPKRAVAAVAAAAATITSTASAASALSVASSTVPLTTSLAATPTSLTKRPTSAPARRPAAAAAAAASPLLLPPSVTPFTAASTPPAAPAAAAAMAETAKRLAEKVTTPKDAFNNLKEFTKLVKDTLDGREDNKMELVKLIAGDLGYIIVECITNFKEKLTKEKKDSLFPIVEGLQGILEILEFKAVKDEVEAIQFLEKILDIMNKIMSIITNKKKGGARKTRRAQKTRRRRARKTRR